MKMSSWDKCGDPPIQKKIADESNAQDANAFNLGLLVASTIWLIVFMCAFYDFEYQRASPKPDAININTLLPKYALLFDGHLAKGQRMPLREDCVDGIIMARALRNEAFEPVSYRSFIASSRVRVQIFCYY
jgi:hypothetical protein